MRIVTFISFSFFPLLFGGVHAFLLVLGAIWIYFSETYYLCHMYLCSCVPTICGRTEYLIVWMCRDQQIKISKWFWILYWILWRGVQPVVKFKYCRKPFGVRWTIIFCGNAKNKRMPRKFVNITYIHLTFVYCERNTICAFTKSVAYKLLEQQKVRCHFSCIDSFGFRNNEQRIERNSQKFVEQFELQHWTAVIVFHLR